MDEDGSRFETRRKPKVEREAAKDTTGAISWLGEEIPVPIELRAAETLVGAACCRRLELRVDKAAPPPGAGRTIAL